MLDAHTPVVQFFASKRHHKILFHGNKLDRITGRMMDEEIKRRQLKVRLQLSAQHPVGQVGVDNPPPPVHIAHGSART